MDLNATYRLFSRLKIRDRDSARMVPFHLNYNQQLAWDKIVHNHKHKRPHKYIILKSRRVGMSSLFDAIGFAHCLALPNANGLILAHKADSSKELFKIPLGLAASLPFRLPAHTQRALTIPHRAGNSKLSIATAGHATSGRGWTLSYLHLSEAAFFPAEAAFPSLLPAVSDDLSSWIVIESTANGTEYEGEAFYKLWLQAVEGDTEWTPIFLTWLDDPSCVRPAETAKDAPIDDEEKFLLEEKKATLEQIAWRRMKLDSPDCAGRVEVFNQEYPVTWDRAFISSGYPAFDLIELDKARHYIESHPPMLTGRMQIEDGKAKFLHQHSGPLVLWEKPIEKHKYYVGVDAARGEESGDFASFVVWNGTTGEQAARFADHTPPEVMAELVNGIGRYFNNAMVNVEYTGNLGYMVAMRLRDEYKYPNTYRWRGRDDRLDKHASRHVGWETTDRTRDMMYGAFRAGLRENEIVIKDPALHAQMKRATMRYGRFQVEKDHDDILFAAMLGWIARVHWPPPLMVNSKGSVLADDLKPELAGDPPSIIPPASVNSVDLGGGVSYQYNGATVAEARRLSALRHIGRVQGYIKNKNKVSALEGI